MAEVSLFIGNGLNRLPANAMPWVNVLGGLAWYADTPELTSKIDLETVG
jgi:hypothetical protein